jgi:hypothetical protein
VRVSHEAGERMTTRRTAEALLFEKPEDVMHLHNVSLPEPMTTALSATRRRVCATYCPICAGWVEVRLRPVRLHCTGCGLEARP